MSLARCSRQCVALPGRPFTTQQQTRCSRLQLPRATEQDEQATTSSGSPMAAPHHPPTSLQTPLLPNTPQPPAPAGQGSWTHLTLYKGVKLAPAAVAIGMGLAVRYLAPIPDGITEQGWALLSLFVTVISGLVLGPLPTGAWALFGATVGLATHTLTFEQMFAASNNTVVWLVTISFFLAKGFEKTGLGDRIANQLLLRCGTQTLGLAIGLAAAETLVAPAMPSTTSRGAGIFMPVINSVARAEGSLPGDDSRMKLGAFLTMSQFQASVHSSNFVMTAAAQNLLCLQLAASVGAPVPDPFVTWLQGSCVPAVIGVVLTPCLLYWIWPPAITSTPDAPVLAAERLQQMGPVSTDEGLMIAAVLTAVTLWVFGSVLGVEPVTAAMLGLSMLLLTGVLSWPEDCLTNTPAWDTLLWFSVLISMSLGLQSEGVIDAFSGWAGGQLAGLSMGWPATFAALHMLFFCMHYLFASQTAHVGALYAAFASLMISAGVPPQLAVMSLAYNVNLFGSITHYASGQAAVYFGAGYLTTEDVFKYGAASAVASLLLWGSVGMAWWKVLGWY